MKKLLILIIVVLVLLIGCKTESVPTEPAEHDNGPEVSDNYTIEDL
jgi:hypothetical protein